MKICQVSNKFMENFIAFMPDNLWTELNINMRSDMIGGATTFPVSAYFINSLPDIFY